MARETREIEEVVTKTEVVRVTCDRCGRDITAHRKGSYPESPEPINSFDFALKVAWGNSWPEGGMGQGFGIADVCVVCALELRDILRQHGFTVTDEDWDW